MTNNTDAAIDTLSFENAMAELETIVKDMETGKAALKDSISSYERGIALKKHCENKLKEAQEKIEQITINNNGEVSTKPFVAQE